MDIRDIAKELIQDIDPPFGMTYEEYLHEVKTGLEGVMVDEQLTLKQLRDQCWDNGDEMFGKIYGC